MCKTSIQRSACAQTATKTQTWWKNICQKFKWGAMVGAIALGVGWNGTADKALAVVTEQVGPFTINFLENGDSVDGKNSNATFTKEQRDSIVTGVRYWATTIDTSGVAPGSIIISVIPDTTISTASTSHVGHNTSLIAGDGEIAVNPNLNAGNNVLDTQLYRMVNKGAASGTGELAGVSAQSDVIITVNPTNYITKTSSQVLRNGGTDARTLTDMMIHEMGHAIGISSNKDTSPQEFSSVLSRWDAHLRDIYGEAATPGMDIAINGTGTGSNNIFNLYEDVPNPAINYIAPTFHGQVGGAIEELLGTGNFDAAILGTDSGAFNGNALAHTGQMNQRMSYGNFMTMPYFSELELAMLEEMGYDVNRQLAFGRSYYHDFGGVEQTGDTYNQSVMYGVGAHVNTDDLNLRQTLDISSDGTFGTGIRIDGSNNNVRISDGTTVQANGAGGAALLISFGHDNTIISQGDLIATGTNGIGAWFEIGDGRGRNAGSYFSGTTNSPDPRIQSEYEAARNALDGALVENFDISGSISGNAKAIYIADNAHVGEINIMNNAARNNTISGDIISDYTAFSDENDAYMTILNFGKTANTLTGASTNYRDASFDFSFFDNIGGEGRFELQTWGGTTLLAGGEHKFYSGLLRDESTLELKGVGETSFATYLNIWDGATLRGFNDSRALTVEKTISNYGTIENFSTISTKEKLFNQFSGTLRSNGVILAKNGLDNDGRIEPGGATIGTMQILGSFVNNNDGDDTSNGTLAVDINGNTAKYSMIPGVNNDLITVAESAANAADGTVEINGGVVEVTNLDNGFYRGGTQYTFLQATDGITVNEAMTATEAGLGIQLFKPVLGFDANNYWLTLQRDYIYGPQGRTFNQRSFGAYLDDIGNTPDPTGDLFPVLLALDGLNTQPDTVSNAALHALDSMSGAIYGSNATIGLQNTSVVNNTLNNQLRQPFHCCPATLEKDWDVWAIGYGTGGSVDSDGNAAGFDYSIGGTLVGLDRRIDCYNRLGFFFSYGEGNMSLDGLSESSKSRNTLGGLYFKREGQTGYFMTHAGLGYNDYSTKRNIDFVGRRTEANFGGYQGMAYAERGWKFGRLQPFAGLQYVGLQQNGFTENGAGVLDLKVDAFHANSLQSALGTRYAWDRTLKQGRTFTFDLHGIWMHEFLDDTYSPITAQFSNPNLANFESNAQYTVHGVNLNRDYGVFGTGLNYNLGSLRVFGGYDLMVGSRQALHTGNVGVALCW